MKLMKKMINILLIAVMLFTDLVPYPVFAAGKDDAQKGDIYNPVTDSIGTPAIVTGTSYDPTKGETYDAGDVEVQKIVSKTDTLGKYKIEFKVRGKKTNQSTSVTKPVYAVVVLDKSGSMKTCTEYYNNGNCKTYDETKWNNAVTGAEDFAKTLLQKIPTAKIALVTFSGLGDQDCSWVDYGRGDWRWECETPDVAYNDATVVRGFETANFDSVNFGSPTGGTNLEAGLYEAKKLLDGTTVPSDAMKYVVVIGDGEPTFYYNNNGYTEGPGNVQNGSIETSVNEATSMATSIKSTTGTNAKIYAIGYEVNDYTESVLRGIASPDEVVNGTTITYYSNANGSTVGGALTNIATSISYFDAGTNATLTDNLGSSFTLSSGSNTLKLAKITEEWQSMGSFEVTIDPDATTGWHATNNGFTLTYTDANNKEQTINCNKNPEVYWVQPEYNYTIEYYYDNVKDSSMTVTGTAPKNATVTVSNSGDKITVVKNGQSSDINKDGTKTGYDFVNYNPTDGNLVISNTGENIIKVYYEKRTLTYNVEHYLEDSSEQSGYKLQEIDKNISIKYGETATYSLNNYAGYIYNSNLTTPKNQNDYVVTDNNLVIKLYYDKGDFGYTVEYYYDGVIDNSKTESKEAEFNSQITTYTDKVTPGYKLEKTENLPLTITENITNNVIKVYYVKDDFGYTVEYYYDGVIDNSKTESKEAEFNSQITTYTDKVTTGYKLEKTENLPLTITENEENNVIKVYYVKDDFAYTVEYYYDGVIDNSKTETKEAEFNSQITTYTDKVTPGYKLEKTENLPLTITENEENNVIKVYYVKDDFGYTVEYYYDGVIDNSKTETKEAEFNSQITTYTDKVIPGYKLSKVENLPLIITENEANNVIKVYYVKDDFGYTVEYYYDGVIDNSKTDSFAATYQDVIKTYIDKNITGYKLEKTENLPLTITENEENNVIKIYYVKDDFSYTVEYYYDGVIDNSKTETKEAEFNSQITTYTDKVIPGYKFEKTENLPLTITENEANNIVKVYYIKDEFGYTVEYYYDGVIDNSKTEEETATYKDVIETYTDKVIPGYKLEKTENLPLTITENEENNVIKVYYVKDDFAYTVEYYYDGVIDNSKTETKEAEFNSQITTYTDKVTPGYKLEKTENFPLTITENEANNVIKVYYVKDEFGYTVEYYYEGIIDASKTEEETATYKDVIETYIDKVIAGYKFEKTENLPLTITENEANNVIKVYYVKDEFKYTVEYYYDGIIDTSKTEEETAKYRDVIETYIDKVIPGYKLEKTEKLPLTITENEANNVIKVYYVKDEFKYTVEYYYDGIIDTSKTEEETATYQDVINTYTDKVIPGYKLEKEENLPLTITENEANNVIKIYYVKDQFNYIVEHYLQNLDGTYTKDTTDYYYDVDFNSDAIYELNEYSGFIYNSTKTVNGDSKVPANDYLIIELYYDRKLCNYEVEYYYNNIIDDSKTDKFENVQHGTIISDYTDKNITGYKFVKDENKPLEVLDGNANIIKVYYEKDNFKYTVEYYYDGIIDASKTDTFEAEYQSEIKSYVDKNITGYKLEKTENVPLIITENESDNVIRIYYVKDNFSYKVEHYLENLDGTYTLADTDEYYDVEFDSEAIYELNEYAGYKNNSELTENGNSKVPANNDLIIKLYYDISESKVIVHYVIQDVDTGEYIPFDIYGRDHEGNNTEDFKGIDLEDLVIVGEVGSEFNTTGRNPIDYEFIGLYNGNTSNLELISNSNSEYTGTISKDTIELTYVYMPPFGGPPQTGVEDNQSMYLSYILFALMMTLTYGYVSAIRKED